METVTQQPQAPGRCDAADAHYSVRDVVARLEARTDRDSVPMRDLLAAFGRTSFVPALMVPALVVVSPLSGVPLVSSLCGIAIAVIAAQMVWRRDHLWLPDFVMKREIPAHKLNPAIRHMQWIAARLDRYSRVDRFHRLVGPGGRIVAQSLCVIAGALMPLLELVPFTSSILGAAVLCFAVGFLTRDGLFAVLGMAVLTLAALVPVVVLIGSGTVGS